MDSLKVTTEARKTLSKDKNIKNMLTLTFIAANFKKFLVEQKGF